MMVILQIRMCVSKSYILVWCLAWFQLNLTDVSRVDVAYIKLMIETNQ